MKDNVMKKKLYVPSFDVDNRVLWLKGTPELTAKSDFEYSSVRYKGYLNLDKRMEELSGNLGSGSIVDSSLSNNFLDSSDWDVTHGLSVFKGKGRHVSNELESSDVILEDEELFDDELDNDNFSYGGFKYNELFFIEDEDLEENDNLCDDLDNDLDDDDDLDEDLFEDDFEDEELQDDDISYILSSFSNVTFKDVNFIFLENSFSKLSKSELKSLIKKELKLKS